MLFTGFEDCDLMFRGVVLDIKDNNITHNAGRESLNVYEVC